MPTCHNGLFYTDEGLCPKPFVHFLMLIDTFKSFSLPFYSSLPAEVPSQLGTSHIVSIPVDGEVKDHTFENDEAMIEHRIYNLWN